MYKPGQDRVLIVSEREGIPERRRFYTIETKVGSFMQETMFFLNRADRDRVLVLLNNTERKDA